MVTIHYSELTRKKFLTKSTEDKYRYKAYIFKIIEDQDPNFCDDSKPMKFTFSMDNDTYWNFRKSSLFMKE